MIDAKAIIAALTSHAQSLGVFDAVNGAEPKAAPGYGLTAAVWVETIRPTRARSGLDATTVILSLFVRLYSNLIQTPEDAVDPNMVAALDLLMGAYTGNFTLGIDGDIDLLGAYGSQLEARAGYIKQADRTYRVYTITVPIVLNDVWDQEG